MFDQRKKTALVTGASSGMGKKIAKRLIDEGFQVYVAARHVDKMNDLTRLGAKALRLDISKDEDIRSVAETILGEVDFDGRQDLHLARRLVSRDQTRIGGLV